MSEAADQAIRASIATIDVEIGYVNRLMYTVEETRQARLKPLYERQNELFKLLLKVQELQVVFTEHCLLLSKPAPKDVAEAVGVLNGSLEKLGALILPTGESR